MSEDQPVYIYEQHDGFHVGDKVFTSLREAIEEAGDRYAFIPNYRGTS